MTIRFRWAVRASAVSLSFAGALAFGCGGSAAGPGGSDSPSSGSSASDSGSATGSKSGGGLVSGSGASGSGSASGNGSGSSSSTGSGGSRSGSNKSCGISEETGLGGASPVATDFEACAVDAHPADTVPVDLFIMVDQSISMEQNRLIPGDSSSPTRWEVMTKALKGFIQSPDSAGTRVGLQYFGLNDNGAVVCDASVYASADVEIAELPDNSAALVESIDAHFPSSQTPSVPALEGALSYARDWAVDHPDRSTMVVFATDGYPTECEKQKISDLEAVAKAYAEPTDGSPRVPTFVVGIGEVANLERVALAGGTSHAFFVGACDTAVADLQVALTRIASSPASCEFAIPEANGSLTDLDRINFSLSPEGGGAPVTFPRLKDATACGGGWYFDDNDKPTKIIACPSTCSQFGSGRVDVIVGCATINLE
jgi:hypothetical protein